MMKLSDKEAKAAIENKLDVPITIVQNLQKAIFTNK